MIFEVSFFHKFALSSFQFRFMRVRCSWLKIWSLQYPSPPHSRQYRNSMFGSERSVTPQTVQRWKASFDPEMSRTCDDIFLLPLFIFQRISLPKNTRKLPIEARTRNRVSHHP